MPRVSQNVGDMIRRILVADPIERLTIEGIKEHPAFRIGLDESYVLPSPLRPRAVVGISLPEKVVKILKTIGYREVQNLWRPERTESDVTAAMIAIALSGPLDLSSLPWDTAQDGAVLTNEIVRSETVALSGYRLTGAIMHVQQIARELGLLFCHPDGTRLYLSSGDGRFYLTAVGAIAGHDTVTLSLTLHRGSLGQFEALRNRISEVADDRA
jgi:hypothetical protein